MTDFAGKTTLITGGAGGLGRAVAQRIVDAGGRVVIWDLREDAASEAAESLGDDAFAYGCDVSDRQAVYAAAERTLADVGRVDILLNNAGIVSGKHFLDLPDERIEATFGVNSLALFWTAKAFLPAMIERNEGHVVTIASAAGTIGVKKLTDYCASKWAAVGFDESLRMELAERAPGVRTTVVCPFYIDTGMFDGVHSKAPFLPILKESKVADDIVSAIRRERQRVFLPPIVGLLPMLRAAPTPVFDWAANAMGINATMDHFRGRGE